MCVCVCVCVCTLAGRVSTIMYVEKELLFGTFLRLDSNPSNDSSWQLRFSFHCSTLLHYHPFPVLWANVKGRRGGTVSVLSKKIQVIDCIFVVVVLREPNRLN